MQAWFASGQAVDLILLVVAVEMLGAAIWRRRIGRGLGAGAMLRLVLPGVFLLLALRAALVGAGWYWIAAALLAAFAAHLHDLVWRWRE